MIRNIHICNQTWFRKIFWQGGVYYINFGNDISAIIVWLHENLKNSHVKITQDNHYEGTSRYDIKNDLSKSVYKVKFRTKADFVAFKLRWL